MSDPSHVPQLARVPGLLLVGASARNAGKTTFLTRVVANLSRRHPLVAVKATVIRNQEDPGGCARGGTGCGVCRSLGSRPYILHEETGEDPDKDTAKLLAAGATKVLWVRIAEAHMAQARDALLDRIPPGVPIVCESNSFRRVVEPDLFLMMRRQGEPWMKESCRSLLHLCDREVQSDGVGWDLAPESLDFDDQGWVLRRRATAIVMAGGRSTRMGRDKAMIEVDGVPLIQRLVRWLAPRFDEVLISARNPDDYAFLGQRVIADRTPDQGPLHGLACALQASRHDLHMVVPCDLPAIPLALMARLLRQTTDADVAVPVDAEGRAEPLFAAYRRSALPAVQAALDRGDRRMVSFHKDCRVARVPLPQGPSLANLNTPESLETLRTGGEMTAPRPWKEPI